jgi:hypothetical protein
MRMPQKNEFAHTMRIEFCKRVVCERERELECVTARQHERDSVSVSV